MRGQYNRRILKKQLCGIARFLPVVFFVGARLDLRVIVAGLSHLDLFRLADCKATSSGCRNGIFKLGAVNIFLPSRNFYLHMTRILPTSAFGFRENFIRVLSPSTKNYFASSPHLTRSLPDSFSRKFTLQRGCGVGIFLLYSQPHPVFTHLVSSTFCGCALSRAICFSRIPISLAKMQS